MESLFSWITPSAAPVVEEDTAHLPPPDFLSVVRRGSGRRGRVHETTPTCASSLTPLELRLKDLVLDIYSDQGSSSSFRAHLSESEISEIDSGNFSDRPTTSFSDIPLPSPSPVGMATKQRSTTPIRSYNNAVPVHQEQSSHLPSFFSADDTPQVSQDPQLPALSEISQSQFQFGQHGMKTATSGGHSQPSSYAMRSPYSLPTTSPPLSLPVYSHSELSVSPTAAQRNSSSSDLRSLVSRSFQLPPQQTPKQTSTPPHPLPNQPPSPPHPLPNQPPSSPHPLPNQPPSPLYPLPNQPPSPPHPLPNQPPSPPTTPIKDESTVPVTSTMPPKHLTTPPQRLATPPASLIGLPHMQQTTTSGAESVSVEKSVSEPSLISSSEGSQQAEAVLHGIRDNDSSTGISPGLPDSSSQQMSLSTNAMTDTPQLHIGNNNGKILPKIPIRGQLISDSPLSPKDIRDRLVDVTQKDKPQRGIWSSLFLSSEKKTGSGDQQPLSPLTDGEEVDGVTHMTGEQELQDDASVERQADLDSSQPSSLPPSFAPSSDHEKTPMQSHVTTNHTAPPPPPFSSPPPPSSSPPPPPHPPTSSTFTPRVIPLSSKYTNTTSALSPIKMPDHLKPTQKRSSQPSLSLDFVPDPVQTSRIASLPILATPQSPPPQPSESSWVPRGDGGVSLSRQLAEALHSQAHLEGQLESVMTECRELLKERAELNSRLAVMEAEMAAAKREARSVSAGSTMKSVDHDIVKLKEELKKSQSELRQDRKALEAAREEAGRGRMSLQRLQTEVEEMKKTTQSCELQIMDLREQLRVATSRQDEERALREETQHQLDSLRGSHQALEDSKSWMQHQLQEALETKIGLQEELRNVKSSSIASTVRIDQLSRENATLTQQISTLQTSVFQDKARLVTELEEIEADILSKESSYAQLLAENSRLVELSQQRATEIETLSTTVGQTQVERDELQTRERERAEREQSLTEECLALRKSLSVVERRLQESDTELVRRQEELEQAQKVKLGLQERLRQSEASLITKDGAIQSLTDSRDILRRELDMVRQAQQQMEGELEEERRQVVRLQVSLAATEDGSCHENRLVSSLTEMQEHLETENRELKEKLSVREMEVRRWEEEVATLQTQCRDTAQRMQDLQRQLHSTTSKLDSEQEILRERDSIISRLMQENKMLKEESVQLRSTRDNLQSRLNTTLQQKSRLEGQLVEQSSLGELEHLQVTVRERTELQRQLESLKFTHQQELLRTQVRESQLEAELKGVKRVVETAQQQAEKAAQAREETVEKMRDLKSQTKSDRSEMERAVEQAQTEKQMADREVRTLRAELEELQGQCQRLQTKANSMREKLASEAAQKGEMERESGMAALRLRQSAEERERELLERNQSLSIELERLKGRLAGNCTTQQAMRTHTNQLESSLAEREAALTRASAEVQRLLEEQRATDTQRHTEAATLREEAHSLQVELSETQKLLCVEQDHVSELREELGRASHELAKVRTGQMTEGKELTVSEEKISKLERERDELRLELTTVRAQLVVVKTAAESSKRELDDRKGQGEILQQKLAAVEAQYRQAEEEVGELRAQLLRGESVRESSLVGGEGRFDASLSTIGGDAETDSFLPATHESSASVSSHGETSSLSHQALLTAQLRELEQQIEKARRQGQEAAEAKTVGEISVLRDQLGSKSKTITSLQSCLVSLKGDMGKLQHRMQSHSATVRASHYTTKQLEAQLADLKRSSSLQSPSFLSDHT